MVDGFIGSERFDKLVGYVERDLTGSEPSRFLKLAGYVEQDLAGIDPSMLVMEYLKWLKLKNLEHDWGHPRKARMRLSPPWLLRAVWLLHIWDTNWYARECRLLCGRVVHYDPDVEADGDEVERARRTSTRPRSTGRPR
jgi:hypothetical protein